MRGVGWIAGLIGGLLLLIDPCAAAERRLALVIANNAYPGNLRLEATHADGRNLQRSLQKVGFDVRLVFDATKANMVDELRSFVERLQAANASKASGDKVLAFFYFAGHGAQDTLYPGNYVWPIDTKASNSEQLSQSAIKLNDIVEWVAAAGPTSSFLVMDACRNYPFDAESAGVKKGFIAEERDAPRTLIGYAASPGATIIDSNDYSEALASAIEMPSVDAARAFQEVQMRVAEKSKLQQNPSYYNRLLEIVYLKDGAATSYALAPPAATSSTGAGSTAASPSSVAVARPVPSPPARPQPQPSPAAQRKSPVELPPLRPGTAIVTGFSGTVPGADGGSTIQTAGTVVRFVDLSVRPPVSLGTTDDRSRLTGLTAGDIGQVFGIALDWAPGPTVAGDRSVDVFFSATSVYGLPIAAAGRRLERGEPSAIWANGLFGTARGGGPGTIWKIESATQRLSLFADISHEGVANAGPALGQLAFDTRTRQLFVSDLATGMIHRLAANSQNLGAYDHGLLGRGRLGLSPVGFDPAGRVLPTSPRFDPRDPATWGFADPRRRVWGLAVRGDRLFYAVSDGPRIWSTGIWIDGSFADDARLEVDLTSRAAGREVPRIDFDPAGNLYVGLLHGMTLMDNAGFDGRPRPASIMRLRLEQMLGSAGEQRWSAHGEEISITSAQTQIGPGFALGYGYDGAGRIDDRLCAQGLWSTGWQQRPTGTGLEAVLLHAGKPTDGADRLSDWHLALPTRAANQPLGDFAILAPCPRGQDVAGTSTHSVTPPRLLPPSTSVPIAAAVRLPADAGTTRQDGSGQRPSPTQPSAPGSSGSRPEVTCMVLRATDFRCVGRAWEVDLFLESATGRQLDSLKAGPTTVNRLVEPARQTRMLTQEPFRLRFDKAPTGSTVPVDVCLFDDAESRNARPYRCCRARIDFQLPRAACGPS